MREEVSRRGMVFAARVACTILTSGMEQAQIVGPDKILSKVDDSCSQTLFAMMVMSMFRDIPNQLSNLEPVRNECNGYNELPTLISDFSFLLKQAQMTFRWPGFNPSKNEGIERILSAIEKRINSLLINSENGISSSL